MDEASARGEAKAPAQGTSARASATLAPTIVALVGRARPILTRDEFLGAQD